METPKKEPKPKKATKPKVSKKKCSEPKGSGATIGCEPLESCEAVSENSYKNDSVTTYYLSFDIGEINMAYCMINNLGHIVKWGTFSISANTYEKKCAKLITELDTLKLENTQGLCAPVEPLDSANKPSFPLVIVVEQQPRINAKMRVIEGCLIMYYTMRKIEAGRTTSISKIISYSPKYKLKCYTPLKEDAPIVLKCKEGYYKRKKLSIEHCRRLLPRNNKKWIELFEKCKKKDDMSDTFLQALSYMMYDSKKDLDY